MTYLNNHEIVSAIAGMKATIEADPHSGAREFTLRELLKAGIIDAMPESSLDPHRPCPVDWTALQVAIFDNGEPAPSRKRAKVQRTKMRYGGNLKLWTRDQINFRDARQIAWQQNFHLWSEAIAVTVAEELLDDGLIDAATVTLMRNAVDAYCDNFHYAIPVCRGKGTRWLRQHIILVRIEDAAPTLFGFSYPGGDVKTAGFDDSDASGSKLSGNVIAQARLARHDDLAAWSTDDVSC